MLPSEGPAPGRRRIGYVLKMYPRFSETFVVNEILALEDSGEQIDIFSLRLPVDGRFHESLAEVRAPVTYLPNQVKAQELWDLLRQGLGVLPSLSVHVPDVLALPVSDAAAAVQLAMAVRRLGITHLHAHFGSIATDVARVAAGLAGVGYSFTAHAKDIFHCNVGLEDLHRKIADASVVVTVSDYNLRHLQRTFGPGADKVVRIYNGLDLRRFEYSAPADRPPVVVGVGRLVPKKGFTHLVDAVAMLVHEGRDVRLDLVGTGEEEQSLRAQVDALGVHRHVRLLGALSQPRVRSAVRQAAALAAPCVVATDGNRDGLPTVLLEGMALGTPCVATPVTGIPEAVRPEHTGLLTPPGDPAALAKALARLLDDADLRVRLATNARALVESEFDVRQTSERLRDVLVSASRTRAPAVV
jgi:colanic acid/amylovoran biosynthesis glycosyltransferase